PNRRLTGTLTAGTMPAPLRWGVGPAVRDAAGRGDGRAEGRSESSSAGPGTQRKIDVGKGVGFPLAEVSLAWVRDALAAQSKGRSVMYSGSSSPPGRPGA